MRHNRRTFLTALAGLPFAARACGAPVLNDYRANGVCDLNAALRDGPVTLLAETYECLPAKVPPYAVVQGIPNKSRLLFDGQSPAFMPADRSRPCDLVTLFGFDVVAAGPGNAHALYLPSCRHWDVSRMTIDGWGGAAVMIYGQRENGLVAPSDATKCEFEHIRALRCGSGFVLTGTPDTPRIRGGASNMHTLTHCLASDCEGDGFAILQGSANRLDHCIAGQCRNGFVLAWYGNVLDQPIFERNREWGIYETNHDEARQNSIRDPWNGGANGGGVRRNPNG